MHKRGQFFLIAALIVIAAIVGFQSVYTSVSISGTDTQTYDLSREIDFEGKQVVQNGVFFSATKPEIEAKVQELTNIYASAHPDSEFLFIYGDENEVVALSYELKDSTFGVSTGGSSAQVASPRLIAQKTRSDRLSPATGNIKVKLNEQTDYDFNLKKGNNFFLIVSREKNDETTIAGN